MDIRITQFASTASPVYPDKSVRLNNQDTLLLVDTQGKILKPGESYIVTISKIHSNNTIIEGVSDDIKKESIEVKIKTTEDQETSVTDEVSGDWN